MYKFEETLEIKAPAQKIYDFLADPMNLLSIWPNMVSVSNIVPSKGGLRDFDWIFRMAGVPLKGHTTVEEAQPAKLVRLRNEGGIPSTFIWTYQGLNGSGTRMTLAVEYSIPTPVVGRIAEVLAKKINERDTETMLANLKDVMEHGATVSAGAAARPH